MFRFFRNVLPLAMSILICQLVGTMCLAEQTSNYFTNYREAIEAAKKSGKFLLIAFYEPNDAARWDELLNRLAQDSRGKKGLERHVVAKLPTTYELPPIEPQEKNAADAPRAATRLLDHSSFAEMLRRPGFAVLDLTDAKSRHFHYVVSVLPAETGNMPTFEHSLALLDLPAGSLTQRTLVLAVRTHPANPQSTAGTPNSTLFDESESHSQHQANINLQGHHNWDSRFHRINATLPGGLLAKEVCAESWPGQTLLEAARDCVHSWSQSPGHWNAVRSHQSQFGYDMKRGSNSIWYATGIFGGRD